MALVRWKLYEPISNIESDFPVNPTEGGRPALKKKYEARSNPQGGLVIWQTPTAPAVEVPFSGVILTEEHLTFLEDWFKLEQEVRITDHLGQQFWAWLTEFTPVPRNRTNNPWSHTYTASYLHLGWEP